MTRTNRTTRHVAPLALATMLAASLVVAALRRLRREAGSHDGAAPRRRPRPRSR